MNLPTAYVDPWAQILHLLPQKVTYKGATVTGDVNQLKGFAAWLMQQLPGVVSDGDPEHRANVFLLWLHSETRYEADQATRMAQQAQVQVAPVNPISHQTVPQQAQMAAPIPQPVAATPTAEAEADSGPGLVCPECQTKTSGLRGMKRHVTMTHKVDWPAFCTKFGLDQKTGVAGAPPVAGMVVAAPAAVPAPPTAAPVPPMFQASGPAQPFVAPAPPPMPAPFNPAAQAPAPFNPPPMAMPSPAAVVAAPAAPLSLSTTQAMPSGPMVAFDPNAVQPGLPGQQQVPFAAPQPVAQIPQQPVWQPPQQPVAPPQFQQQAVAQVVPLGGPSREDMARMLGGAIDLIIVRLLDAATINLQGRADVNQLAATAELRARAELKVSELATIQYGVGKQTAQRHFGELLSQTPGCYMLLNGYNPILPDGYLDILAARVTKFHIVTDGGRQTTTIF